MKGTLIRCIHCNKVINITEWDLCPHFFWDGEEIKETEMDDREAFSQRHQGHKTEKLTPLTPLLSDKPYTEPVKTCYFETTNGNERFLIKQWRDKIDDPFAYEIVNGTIEIENGKVHVQTDALKKQLRMEGCISERDLDIFIDAVQREVKSLDPEKLEVSAEGETPLVSYYKLPPACVERILMRCQTQWNQRQLKQLKDFILNNNEYNDVMTVVVEKEFSIRQKTGRDTLQRASYASQDFRPSNL